VNPHADRLPRGGGGHRAGWRGSRGGHDFMMKPPCMRARNAFPDRSRAQSECRHAIT
jgi:hypothetical protein